MVYIAGLEQVSNDPYLGNVPCKASLSGSSQAEALFSVPMELNVDRSNIIMRCFSWHLYLSSLTDRLTACTDWQPKTMALLCPCTSKSCIKNGTSATTHFHSQNNRPVQPCQYALLRSSDTCMYTLWGLLQQRTTYQMLAAPPLAANDSDRT